jgi:hypothetical protein
MKIEKVSLPDEVVVEKIYLIRGRKVMIDRDLAGLYRVTTGNLNKAVSRNKRRFPGDFMFQLIKEEFSDLIFQIGTSNWGGTRKLPYAFTEQGVAMLSGILNSHIAIDVNIQIMLVFTRMREMLITHKDILLKLETIEKKLLQHDHHLKKHEDEIQLIFKAIKQLINTPNQPRTKIGYRQKGDRNEESMTKGTLK